MMPSPPHSAANVNLLHRRAPRPGVLVVDDGETIRGSIAMLLEDEGYTVHQASNGAQALDLLRAADAPLVVLLDWMMPVLNGLEVLDAAVQEPVSLSRHTYIFRPPGAPNTGRSAPHDRVAKSTAYAAAGPSQDHWSSPHNA